MDSTILAAIIGAIISGLISGTIEIFKKNPPNHVRSGKNKKQIPVAPYYTINQENRFMALLGKVKCLFLKYLGLSFHVSWELSFIKYFALVFSLYMFFFAARTEKRAYIEQHIVKVSDYRDYLAKTRIVSPIDLDKQNSDDAIVNVTWYDARKYCDFMKGRLFTKAEWRKYLDSNDVIWNLREWTDTDTLNNCAIVCDISSLELENDYCSYEPKSKYGSDITFRCAFYKTFSSGENNMKKYYLIIAYAFFVVFLLPLKMFSQGREFEILSNGSLSALTSFGVGVDDSKQLRNWLKETVEGLEIDYPGSLQWGSVFITSGGDAVPPPRESLSIDLSKYKELVVEMKGELGNECVKIGIKDCDDPDNGSEPKVEVTISKEWKKYVFDIHSSFGKRPPSLHKLNMKKLYVVCEFVFPCKSNISQTIYVKNIYYRGKRT